MSSGCGVTLLVAGDAAHGEGGAGGGGRVLHLDEACSRHQLPVVLPHHELRGHDSGTDNQRSRSVSFCVGLQRAATKLDRKHDGTV